MNSSPLAMARAEAVWELLAREISPLPPTSATIQAAIGAVLAHDAKAGDDFPPFDRAVMDGYAVRSADFSATPTRLRDIGLVRAGAGAGTPLGRGECARINTGAPIPPGADAVVMIERSRPAGDDWVEIDDRPAAGENLERRGGVRRRGDVIVPAPTRIDPGVAAALAAAGFQVAEIFGRPRVTILTTGDELVSPGSTPGAGQIFDSNAVSLSRLTEFGGGEVQSRHRAPDDRGRLRAELQRGLNADVLLVSGGMSKGTHDLVPATLEELGAGWLVTSLDLKPGKPTRIGRGPNGTWIVGLPGNPVSCAVCFLLFARCVLDGLQGLPVRAPARLTGWLESPMPANGARPMFHPGRWRASQGEAIVRSLPWRGSGDPFGLAEANALVYRPEHVGPAAAGDPIAFVPLSLP
jgi:molybdopterin molybdotransferase